MTAGTAVTEDYLFPNPGTRHVYYRLTVEDAETFTPSGLSTVEGCNMTTLVDTDSHLNVALSSNTATFNTSGGSVLCFVDFWGRL